MGSVPGFFQASILGLVQGLTEFLPISSSAHLALIPTMMRWPYQGLAYDVALHWGTLVALAAYFRKDWVRLISAGMRRPPPEAKDDWSAGGAKRSPSSSSDRRLFYGILLATIPGVLAGLLFEDCVGRVFHNPNIIAWMLILFGIFLGLADRKGSKSTGVDSLNWKSCLLIGSAQALAIFPGVSRSGITLTAGLLVGLRREEAARFSFLLAMPIVVGAGILKFKDLDAAFLSGPFWAGIVLAGLSGFASIRFLLSYLRKKDLGVFVFYRICLGLLILILFLQK